MIPPTIFAPTDLTQLADWSPPADGDVGDVCLVGGGTLEVPRWRGAGSPRFAVYVPALVELRARAQRLCGAARTLAQIADDPLLHPLLRETAAVCATPAVRNVATLGGNLAAGRPGCLAVALLALDGTARVFRFGAGVHESALSDVIGLAPPRSPGLPDVIVDVRWRDDPEVSALRRMTLQSRCGPVLATVAMTARQRADGPKWSLAVSTADAWPQRMPGVEALLDDGGATAREAGLIAAAELILRPSEEADSDVEHRRHVVGVLVERAVEDAVARGIRHIRERR